LLGKRGFTLSSSSTQADALSVIAATTLEFRPGSRFSYSNSNYVLLAEVVRAVTGKPLPAVLSERIFAPAGLDMRMDPSFDSKDTAVPYTVQGTALMASRSGWQQLGDGSVFTTPGQLALWGDNYRTGRIGGAELLASALQAAVPTDLPDDRYGPGIDLGKDGTLSHSGSWSGFVTAFVVSSDRSTTLAVSCNSASVDLAAIGGGLLTIWLPGK
jgi:CubicO group peptidase (beta-lactamase class C family)